MPDLTLIRGDDRVLNFLLRDPNSTPTPNEPIDLTGADLWFYIKDRSATADADAVLAKGPADIVVDPDQVTNTGQATLTLVPSDTESIPFRYLDTLLDWEVQLQDNAGTVQTVGRGTVLVESDIVHTPNATPASPADLFTYDPTTTAGRVRLLSQDFDPNEMIFSDAEITAFLELNSNGIYRAAAAALRVIAANEVYVQKRIKILDLWTDGPAEAEALRKLAEVYDLKAVEEAATSEDEMFDWAEHVYDVFGAREAIYKSYLRSF